MDYTAFEKSLIKPSVPKHWPESLQSLWHIAKGNWEASHNIAQDLHTNMGSWIHAHLHRVEGDNFNARYWYGQAGRPYCTNSFEDEVKEIADHILSTSTI